MDDPQLSAVGTTKRGGGPEDNFGFIAVVHGTEDRFVGEVQRMILQCGAGAGPDSCTYIMEHFCRNGSEQETPDHAPAMVRKHDEIGSLVLYDSVNHHPGFAQLCKAINVLTGEGCQRKLAETPVLAVSCLMVQLRYDNSQLVVGESLGLICMDQSQISRETLHHVLDVWHDGIAVI